MKFIIFFSILLSTLNNVAAQSKSVKKSVSATDTSAIASVSPIASLSPKEYTAYQKGEPMAMTNVAEVNNYPAPAQVLAFEKVLKLTVSQKQQLQIAVEALDFKAKEMGRFILDHEKKLNDLFYTGKANEGSLIYYCNQIGLYQGELRNAHLQAHLKARRILTPDQLKKYSRLVLDSNKG
ncbi:MAG TPA: hypothetical protein VLZ28_03215 [Daejeonella sp.]|nr:hypothetical protein [Daejeonella sp.]